MTPPTLITLSNAGWQGFAEPMAATDSSERLERESVPGILNIQSPKTFSNPLADCHTNGPAPLFCRSFCSTAKKRKKKELERNQIKYLKRRKRKEANLLTLLPHRSSRSINRWAAAAPHVYVCVSVCVAP